MSPALLEETGFLRQIGGVIVSCGEVTYRSAGVETEIVFCGFQGNTLANQKVL